jgi:hypothetical protein
VLQFWTNYCNTRSWIQNVNRMPRNRLPRVMKQYCVTGRRNRGRPLKRLLDTWDRNGSKSGSTPWQMMMMMMMMHGQQNTNKNLHSQVVQSAKSNTP